MLLTYRRVTGVRGGGERVPSTGDSILISAGKMVFKFKWQTFTVHSARTLQSVWLAFVSHEQALRFFYPRPKITNHILLETQTAPQEIAANLRYDIKSHLRIRFTDTSSPSYNSIFPWINLNCWIRKAAHLITLEDQDALKRSRDPNVGRSPAFENPRKVLVRIIQQICMSLLTAFRN